MKQAVLSRMLEVSPVHLVVGNGVFGRALSQVMDAQMLSGDELESDPTESGTYPLVLDSLRVVLLVIEASQSLAQAISQHDQIWVWVKRLTRAAECHEIGIVFVPLDGMADSVESLLGDMLGIPLFPCTGVAVWRPESSLSHLLATLSTMGKADYQLMQRRRANQPKRLALEGMAGAIRARDSQAIARSVAAVREVFKTDLHALDSFCRNPFHPNGNSWRTWMQGVVTGSVPQDSIAEAIELLPTLKL
jgi:hypothetical protein